MRKLSTSVFCFFALSAHANVIQYFAGISYNNPSELFKVKNNDFILGGMGSYADLKFTGSALNFNRLTYDSGVNHSKTYTILPYGRIAKRLNKRTVFAVDLTEPFNSNLNWGNDAFTRYAATQNYLIDVDISPKLAFTLNEKWQLGGGINFNFLKKNEINWAMPTGLNTSANLMNVTSSFGVGYNLGATYVINQTNFLGLTYYSQIRQNTSGYSTLGDNISNNLLLSFTMPATTILSYVHIFNPSWLISLQAFQTEWDVNPSVRFLNTASPAPLNHFTFTMNFDKSYAYLAAVRNQYNEKLGITLAGIIDNGPEQDNLRTITFPSYMQYFLAISGDYHITPTTTIELLYGHLISNPAINNQVMVNNMAIPFTTGKVNINVDVIDLKIKVQA